MEPLRSGFPRSGLPKSRKFTKICLYGPTALDRRLSLSNYAARLVKSPHATPIAFGGFAIHGGNAVEIAPYLSNSGRTFTGRFFCPLISDLLNLAPRDIKFTGDSSGMALSILIRSSKTDQEERGATRALRANASILRPAQTLFALRKWYGPSCHPEHQVFPHPSFRSKMTYVMKWDGNAKGIPMAAGNTHSLRARGIRPCFQHDWIAVQR